MNKNELIDAVATKTGSSKTEANRIVNALLAAVSEALEKEEPVSLPGFDTFEVRERGARTGRNPRTGEELQIAASKVVAFKPGAALKGSVNRG